MIDKKLMRPGDILLFKPNHDLVGKFVTWAEKIVGKDPNDKKDNYCHVAIVAEDCESMYQSIFPWSRRTKLDWKKLDKTYYVELWRVKRISNLQTRVVLKWCNDHLKELYDLGIYFFGLFDFKHTEVCSTYVSDAFKSAGINFKVVKVLNDDSHIISPDEIGASILIKRVK